MAEEGNTASRGVRIGVRLRHGVKRWIVPAESGRWTVAAAMEQGREEVDTSRSNRSAPVEALTSPGDLGTRIPPKQRTVKPSVPAKRDLTANDEGSISTPISGEGRRGRR
jgi:hypothetical protein